MNPAPLSKRDRFLGVLLIVLPFVSLIFVLVTWSLFSSALSRMILSGEAPSESFVHNVNIVLGFLGILSVIAVPAGFAVGIYFLLIKERKPQPGQKS